VNLRYNLLSPEVVNAEPEMLSQEVFLGVLNTLAEDERSLSAVIVFESDSFVDHLPGLVARYDVVFVVRRNCSLHFERE
jgi:hypothetical protein